MKVLWAVLAYCSWQLVVSGNKCNDRKSILSKGMLALVIVGGVVVVGIVIVVTTAAITLTNTVLSKISCCQSRLLLIFVVNTGTAAAFRLCTHAHTNKCSYAYIHIYYARTRFFLCIYCIVFLLCKTPLTYLLHIYLSHIYLFKKA